MDTYLKTDRGADALTEYCKGIKGVIFDYGGTIDSGGEHWSEVIWRAWLAAGITTDKESFREAYVHAERTLAREPHIAPDDDFRTLLYKKAVIELAYHFSRHPLPARTETSASSLAERIADYCDASARMFTQGAIADILVPLARKDVPMVLVSNFYGNVERVLEAYGLRRYFRSIVESAVVGVRKPDPEIFRLGVEALGRPAGEVLVIGDSYWKDILPALAAGCKAVWIKGKGWTAEEDAQEYPYIVRNLGELSMSLIKLF